MTNNPMDRTMKYKIDRIKKEITIGIVSADDWIRDFQKGTPFAIMAIRGMSDAEKDLFKKEITAKEYFAFAEAVDKFNDMPGDADEIKKK